MEYEMGQIATQYSFADELAGMDINKVAMVVLYILLFVILVGVFSTI